jgi:hypothetical protein
MDPPKYTSNGGNTTLLGALVAVPDPREARGKQHEWHMLLVILCAALASGHKSVDIRVCVPSPSGVMNTLVNFYNNSSPCATGCLSTYAEVLRRKICHQLALVALMCARILR